MDSDIIIRKIDRNSILSTKDIFSKEETIIVQPIVNEGKENEMKRKLRSSSRTKNCSIRTIFNQTQLKSNLVANDPKNCDTIIFHSDKKPRMDTSVRCRICNKKLPNCFQKKLLHYKIAHYFTSFQTEPDDAILTRMKVDREYYNFCCLNCYQKFNIFDKLNWHRCKLTNSDKKLTAATTTNNKNKSNKQKDYQNEPVIDYNSPEEFFRYLGLRKRSEFKLNHESKVKKIKYK